MAKGADERLLRELLGELAIPGQPIAQPVHKRGVRIVQFARGDPVTGGDAGDELWLVQQASLPGFECGSCHVYEIGHRVAANRSVPRTPGGYVGFARVPPLRAVSTEGGLCV